MPRLQRNREEGLTLHLRPYQSDAISRLRGSIRDGHRAPLLVAPCGAGKTVMFSYIAAHGAGRVVIMAHREELLDQISKTLQAFQLPHTFIASGRPYDPSVRVAVASVQTLARRDIQAPSLIICDEAHHATSPTYRTIFTRWSHATVIGVTASPERLDGTGLGDVFDDMILGPSVTELTSIGALCPFRIYAPSRPDLTGVKTTAGDYNRGGLSIALDRPSITGDAVAHYGRLASGRRAVVFCVSIAHAKHVAMTFQSAGYQAAWLEGGMTPTERDRTVKDFKAGRITVLTSCDLISEGFDLPAIEVAIMLRPTQSTALWIQQAGRALRPMEGKTEALILDHAGNVFKHGMPDADRVWTLEGKKRSKKGAASKDAVRVCPACFGACPTGTTRCPFCGAEFPADPRQVEELAGELAEVEREQVRAALKQEQGRARTLAELVEVGKKRGMTHPYGWARRILQARRRG